MDRRLIIGKDSVYEIDDECVREKQKENREKSGSGPMRNQNGDQNRKKPMGRDGGRR